MERYTLASLPEIILDVVSPYDPVTSQSQILTTLRLPLGPYGTVNGVFRLPEDARLGVYTLLPHDVQFKEITFQVAEYRKPEIDPQVVFQQPEYRFGEDLQAQVTASYFFGAPAGNLPVHWTLFGDCLHLTCPGGCRRARLTQAGWIQMVWAGE